MLSGSAGSSIRSLLDDLCLLFLCRLPESWEGCEEELDTFISRTLDSPPIETDNERSPAAVLRDDLLRPALCADLDMLLSLAATRALCRKP